MAFSCWCPPPAPIPSLFAAGSRPDRGGIGVVRAQGTKILLDPFEAEFEEVRGPTHHHTSGGRHFDTGWHVDLLGRFQYGCSLRRHGPSVRDDRATHPGEREEKRPRVQLPRPYNTALLLVCSCAGHGANLTQGRGAGDLCHRRRTAAGASRTTAP